MIYNSVNSFKTLILGFLSLEDESICVPGNAGLKDQVLALKWIKSNCSFFGGDPNNITVFGESAGGASTHYLMITDQTRDLFHKGILMSGSCLSPWASVPPRNWAHRLATLAGYKGPKNDKDIWEFLKNANDKPILQAEMKLLNSEERRNRILFPYGPVIEPYIMHDCIVPENPILMMRKAWGNNIPMIIGGTSFEGLFSYPETRKHPHILENINDCEYLVPFELVPDRTSEKCKEYGLRLKNAYFGNKKPGKDTAFQYLELLTYKYFWHGMSRSAQSRALHAVASTYLYRFDFDSPDFNHIRYYWCGPRVRGTCHGDDLSYMFLNVVAKDLDIESKEYKTIQRLVGFLVEFARTGDPNCTDEVVWEPVNKENLKCLNIADDLHFIELPENEKLKVWDSLYHRDQLF